MEGTNKILCTPIQEKGAGTPQETDPDLPVSVPRVSRRGVGQLWPAAGSGALSGAVHAQDLFKEATIIFITSTIVWSQIKQQAVFLALPINRKLD